MRSARISTGICASEGRSHRLSEQHVCRWFIAYPPSRKSTIDAKTPPICGSQSPDRGFSSTRTHTHTHTHTHTRARTHIPAPHEQLHHHRRRCCQRRRREPPETARSGAGGAAEIGPATKQSARGRCTAHASQTPLLGCRRQGAPPERQGGNNG